MGILRLPTDDLPISAASADKACKLLAIGTETCSILRGRQGADFNSRLIAAFVGHDWYGFEGKPPCFSA
ncbi:MULTISPECIES: hypothetical protein [Mesorhizobium]|uniref:Uncharacterized protein n=1 Tax=Mesorhizobium shonense TaxID=1209948 RepID=A0ABV2HKJ6_9HYPH|nr:MULTISPECIES: hypothetical protein [unclassified Mesorhizobium]AZO31335.1 hypothetical protein EJ071_30735 [Mesorhizobium sp. M1B.F.Ca.ET.045.04.1.1]RWA64676.1 MAG: hypothetical protein EOQ29_28060 [Mesorhizobium sp.]RWA82964.1 MAG: hypothetical protein EOQ30_14685 [Mesorhizobium sp.]RWB17275.1 MAG: hypothetical protein EOQ40_25895 [Mesorhizobium sp.]RWE00314.1 MAG: hypothetical protein EOS40_15880 [Mesorhizobium sp.]